MGIMSFERFPFFFRLPPPSLYEEKGQKLEYFGQGKVTSNGGVSTISTTWTRQEEKKEKTENKIIKGGRENFPGCSTLE